MLPRRAGEVLHGLALHDEIVQFGGGEDSKMPTRPRKPEPRHRWQPVGTASSLTEPASAGSSPSAARVGRNPAASTAV